MNRKPPVAVLQELRREVGFGCPVPNCGCPYLTWHHFDPTFEEFQHHDPVGMIALCSNHHRMADHGLYTREQLHQFKSRGNSSSIRGQLEWMRRDLLIIIGGNITYGIPKILQIANEPVIWINRDASGHLLLNVRMSVGEQVLDIADNFWILDGNPSEVICPPSGKQLEVKYSDGNYLNVQFLPVASRELLATRYGNVLTGDMSFPISAAEISMAMPARNVQITPKFAKIGPLNLSGNTMIGAAAALML